jgi:hypothetical protein
MTKENKLNLNYGLLLNLENIQLWHSFHLRNTFSDPFFRQKSLNQSSRYIQQNYDNFTSSERILYPIYMHSLQIKKFIDDFSLFQGYGNFRY